MQNYTNNVANTTGDAIVGATVTVLKSDGTVPTLYAANGSSPLPSNVLTTDNTGEYSFFAANGTYTITVGATNFASQTNSGVVLFDPLDIGIQPNSGGIIQINRTGAPAGAQAVGEWLELTNNSTTPGYGRRLDYYQTGVVTSGFTIGDGIITRYDGLNGGVGLASWLVASSPTSTTNTFAICAQEVNPINRSGDPGYTKSRYTMARCTGGILMVAEARDLTTNQNLNTFNCTYGFGTARSSVVNAGGDYSKLYNGLMLEKDSIAPGGRGVLYSGNSLGVGAQNPQYAAEIDQTWVAGLCTTAATFSNAANIAAIFGANQKIAWGTSETDANYAGIYGNGGTLFLNGGGGLNSLRVDAVANQVNSWQIFGGATGNDATLKAIGGDANVNAIIRGSGTSGVILKDGAGGIKFWVNTTGVGFNATAPVAKPTITGSRGGNAALASLLTALASMGLVTDSTTA